MDSKGFSAKNTAFGRAQTFPLRLGWLPKMCRMLESEESMSVDDCITEWGVGKNMVTAMWHWAHAANVAEENTRSLSEFGRLVLGKSDKKDGYDPYMEDEATLWLLHWEIASRPRHFTVGYCLFNWYFKPDGFLPEDAASEITERLHNNGATVEKDPVRRDINTALKMYARRDVSTNEEVLESPFPNLDLITYVPAAKRYYSDFEARDSLPANVVGYAAARLLETIGKTDIPIRDRTRDNPYPSLDAVFRLTEDALLQKLHDFCRDMPAFQLRELAGEWRLYVSGGDYPTSELLLNKIYSSDKNKTC